MEQDPDSPPNIWFQPPLATTRRRKQPIDPVVLIILIPILVLVFLFFFQSPFLLQMSHILKPVKSTWDSLNIFLVIFAILCGVLARKNEGINESTNFVGDSSSINSTGVDSSGHVIGYSDTKVVSGGLRRNSSSYPDLRNESLWENNPKITETGSTTILTCIIHLLRLAPVTVTTAVSPPSQRESSKRHSFRSVGRDVKSYEFEKARTEPPSSPPPPPLVVAETTVKGEPRHLLIPPSPPPSSPPPPHPFNFQNLFKKGVKHKKIHSVPTTITLPTVYPPPPSLPPPPSSIFNSIFKGNKSKRFNSNSSSIMNNVFKTGTKSKRFISTPPPPSPMTPPRYTTPIRSKKLSVRGSHAPPVMECEYRNRRSKSHKKPPLPAKTSYYERDDFPPSGSQSPLIPMPPPPPPPFRMTPTKFELRGDFVRVQSTHSSMCSSPDHDDAASIISDGGDSVGSNSGYSMPILFPSPDVNAKADSYISRLKDKWRMEKNNNYVNKKWD
uniref:Formin-like protein 20 n=1 Tax=Tanacetum cinerariifolium TaxID=118510 RepID=A0A6L2JBP0_TANCI|nr:formin-like protein 20 [Tanacetum cinerariifolium]